MISLFAARRAAEEFAAVVDGSRPDVADRYADLTPTIAALRARTDISPRAEFAADLRARLLAAADTALVPAATSSGHSARPAQASPARLAHRRLGTAAAAALITVTGTAGLAVAAQGALPGDPLYPVKRGVEAAGTAVHATDAGKGASLLGTAGTRLDEVDQLTRSDAPSDDIEATLASFVSTANHGADLLFSSYLADGDTADIAQVRDFAATHLVTLSLLSEMAPTSSQQAFDSALDSLAALDTQARTLCASCGSANGAGPALTSSSGSLDALITQPVATADHEAAVRQLEALAKAAEQASPGVPKASDTSSGTDSGASSPLTGVTTTLPGATSGTKQLAKTTTPVKQTLTGTTDGVTGLIQQLGDATGTSSVTDPLAQTLDQTVSGVTGLLP